MNDQSRDREVQPVNRSRRRMRQLRYLILGVALAATGCGGSPTSGAPRGAADQRNVTPAEVPTTPTDMRGTITRVIAGTPGDGSGQRTGDPNATVSCPPNCGGTGPTRSTVLVEEIPGGLETGGQKASLTVTDRTGLFRRIAGRVVAISFADLRTGQKVEVWYDGPVAESYPLQGKARAIIVD
jgi:hypothetical protein